MFWPGLPCCQLLPHSGSKSTGLLCWEARQILHWNAGNNALESLSWLCSNTFWSRNNLINITGCNCSPLLHGRSSAYLPDYGCLRCHEEWEVEKVKNIRKSCKCFNLKVHLWGVRPRPWVGRGLHRGPRHDCRVCHLPRAELLPRWLRMDCLHLKLTPIFFQTGGKVARSMLYRTSQRCTTWPWRSSSSPLRFATRYE